MSTFWQDLVAGVVYTWIDEWIDVVESHTCRWRQRPEDGELLTEAVWDGRRVIYMDIYFCHAVLPHLTWNDHTVSLPFYSTSWTIHNVFCYCFMVTKRQRLTGRMKIKFNNVKHVRKMDHLNLKQMIFMVNELRCVMWCLNICHKDDFAPYHWQNKKCHRAFTTRYSRVVIVSMCVHCAKTLWSSLLYTFVICLFYVLD